MISILPISQNSSLSKFFCTITLVIFIEIGRDRMKKEQNIINYIK